MARSAVKTEQDLLAALREHYDLYRAWPDRIELGVRVGRHPKTVGNVLRRLARSGQVVQIPGTRTWRALGA